MLSLVGANLLTRALEPTSELQPNIIENTLIYQNSTFKPSEICKSDFGCDGNICWRSCIAEVNNEGKENVQSWCYAAPKSADRKFHPCERATDCSPCWECTGPCHFQNS